MIYVYAIGECDRGVSELAGIDDLPIEAIECGGLCAFVSRGLRRGVDPGSSALWRHEAVVEELMADGAVLPFRFGTVVAGEAALIDVIDARSDEFTRSLARVRGRVEMGVRALWDEDDPPRTATSGRAYLAGKLERRRAAQQIADDLHPSFSELAAATTCRVLPENGIAFAASYLVDRAHMHELERRVEQFGDRRADVDVVCTGPWPPYSFSGPGDD